MSVQTKRSKFFIFSVIFHIVILFVFVVSFEWNAPLPVIDNTGKSTDIIKAVVMNPTKIQRQQPVIAASPPKPKPEAKKIEPPKPLPPKPVAKISEVKKILTPPPTVKEKIIALPDPNKKEIEKKSLETDLLAEIKKQKNQHKKIKHAEVEQAFEKELKTQIKTNQAKTLEEQLRQETNRLASSAQAEKMRGVVDKYKALILQSISQHWLVPNGVNKSLSSQLLIRVAPGGVVLDVQLVKSSGDDALDRSARTAVFKASPLPVPMASDEFEPFREFILKVKPENILAQESAVG